MSVRWLVDGYDEWLQREGVKVVGDLATDLMSVETAPWDRIGAEATFVHLDARGDTNNLYVVDVAPGKATDQVRHVYEAVTYVVDGSGFTTFEMPTGESRSFEWGRGSLFALPVNAPYRHHNASGVHRARLASVTWSNVTRSGTRLVSQMCRCSRVGRNVPSER